MSGGQGGEAAHTHIHSRGGGMIAKSEREAVAGQGERVPRDP